MISDTTTIKIRNSKATTTIRTAKKREKSKKSERRYSGGIKSTHQQQANFNSKLVT